MKELILDTSSQFLFVNIVIDGLVKYSVMSEGKNNHSDNLLKVIEEGFIQLDLKLSDIDRIVCGYGPGMYTGLRVSLTVAKMFSWTLNIPLYVISSLDLLASGYFDKDGVYSIMIKAKKDHSYTKRICVKDSLVSVIKEEEFMKNEDFIKYTSSDDIIIENSNIKIYYLNIKESDKVLVTNVHALEPNYLRQDIWNIVWELWR